MRQILHGNATTIQAMRRAIHSTVKKTVKLFLGENSQESLRTLSRRYGINQKTVVNWKRRTSTADLPTGPRDAKSTVLSQEEEAAIAAFRKHTLLTLDDCLYALQSTIPHLTRSSFHRCLQRHDISRLPEVDGDKPNKKRFKSYAIGYFHIDIAERVLIWSDSLPWKAKVTGFGSCDQTIFKTKEVTLMIETNERIIKHKVGLLNLAEELATDVAR